MLAIVMQTDFGTDNLSVSSMVGVCRGVCDKLQIYNATHAVRPFDVLNASDCLMYNLPFWPKETVFVSVVDPGVGTARKSCVAKLNSGHYIVTPDNGTLTYVKKQWGIQAVREIDESVNRYPTTRDVHIFHGRDVYAYCAARLAAGVIDFQGVGPEYPVEQIVEATYIEPGVCKGRLEGMVNEASEHFGLVGTNIPFEWLAQNGINYGDRVSVIIENKTGEVFHKDMLLAKSFGFVGVGELLALQGETGTVMIAQNQDNFAVNYKIDSGADWKLTIFKAGE